MMLEPLTKLAVRRLEVLCRYFDTLSPDEAKHFGMQDWLDHDEDIGHCARDHVEERGGDPQQLRPSDVVHACGTTACAAGHAATLPYFQKLGMKVDAWGQLTIFGEAQTASRMWELGYVFDLTPGQVDDLFRAADWEYSEEPTTAHEWRDMCRDYIQACGVEG